MALNPKIIAGIVIAVAAVVVILLIMYFMKGDDVIEVEVGPEIPVIDMAPMPIAPIDRFTLHQNRGCKGRNELGFESGLSAAECAQVCANNPACTAFEINPNKTRCQLSSTCNAGIATSYPKWQLYTRN